MSLKELENEPLVDFQPDWGTRKLVDRTFAEARVMRQTAFEVGDLQVLLDLVARGLGIALVPEPIAVARAADARGAPIGMAELREPGICWELVVAFAGSLPKHEPKNPAASAFLGLIETQKIEEPVLSDSRLPSPRP